MPIVEAPNKEYLELNFCGKAIVNRGKNEQVTFERISDNTFRLSEGRVGIEVGRYKPISREYPMDDWNIQFMRFINKGYIVTKEVKQAKKEILKSGFSFGGCSYKELEDTSVQSVITNLIRYTNAALSSQYKIKVSDITDYQMKMGREILDNLTDNYESMSVSAFNNELYRLFSIVPRRMDFINKVIAKTDSDKQNVLAREQELFDLMISQVKNHSLVADTKLTVLDAFDLSWREATEQEKINIIRKMGSIGNRLSNAWRITNNKTERCFNSYCKKENLTEQDGISHLFHGSRNENFWSIITNGLTINPKNVVITGKAFGNGTYFAPNANKSYGYTSARGSRWANGNSNVSYMGIYKVATGKCYDPIGVDTSLTWKRLQEKCPGAHCTWATSHNSGFMMDEVIVYQDFQSTIEYLVELKI